jgi:hypothetical protein
MASRSRPEEGGMKRHLPTVERLHKLLRLDPETGRLYWRVHRGGTATQGSEAFTAVSPYGYRRGTIDGKQFLAHRVVYALAHGRLPDCDVDHMNGNPADNRPCNLRDVVHATNMRNQFLGKHNRTGVVGVSWDARKASWRATIVVDYRQTHVGYYASIEEAAAARKAAEAGYGFTERHGERRAA